MRVLWIVNKMFAYTAEQLNIQKNVFGGWLDALHEELLKKDNIDIAIATIYGGKEMKTMQDDKTLYYLLPCKNALKYNTNLEQLWKIVVKDFNPDLIHIHGSEFAHALPLFKDGKINIPTILSVQGLISECSKAYYANIKLGDIITNITFRDIIKCDTILDQKRKFESRGLCEKKLISNVDNAIGRTSWDNNCIMQINPNIIYYKNNENLRESFYNNRWNISKIRRNTIFFSQASYPLKGLHIMLEALYKIKKTIPDIRINIAGENIIENSNFVCKIKRNGYAKYLLKLIKKYNLYDNVKFLGILDEQEMCNEYLKCNVFVQASSLENSPNSLGEAMLLGVPCVASNVGGTSDMLKDKKEGLLYSYTDSDLLAHYVLKILNDDDIAVKIGEAAHTRASMTHDREKNTVQLLNIYNSISEEINE